jgi:long-chain acyl-CoA synthetase
VERNQAMSDLPVETLPELLRQRAKEAPDKPFLFFKDQVWTRKELDLASDAIARKLEDLQITTGERAALILPNGPEFIIHFFGILKAGGIAVPVNTALKEEEISFILKDSGASVLLIGSEHKASGNPFKHIPTLKTVLSIPIGEKKSFWLDLGPAFLAKACRRFSGNGSNSPLPDSATLIYTSGTTGFPKGAELTHRNYLFDVEKFVAATQMNESDRFLCFLPLFHVNAQVVTLLSPLYCGGAMVLMDKFSPKEFFETLSAKKATAFSGVPSVYSVLLGIPESANYDLSSLRFCICGAAPMPVEVFERFEKKFNAYILEGYGLSEGTCVSSINPPPPQKRKIGSIGLPLKHQEMKILDANDRQLPRGETGEIAVKGENVMKGYWNNPEATLKTIRNGWLYTGDMGYQDQDGFFFIVGRSKEMIIRGGENIYPKEVEEALYRHPAILEAAVIGLPNERWGEEVAAFVVLKEGQGLSAKDIREFIKDKIADYKIPRRIEIVLALPKTATGKIQKLKLRAEIMSRERLK